MPGIRHLRENHLVRKLETALQTFSCQLVQLEEVARLNTNDRKRGRRLQAILKEMDFAKDRAESLVKKGVDKFIYPVVGTAPGQWVHGLLCEVGHALDLAHTLVEYLTEWEDEPFTSLPRVEDFHEQLKHIRNRLDDSRLKLTNLLPVRDGMTVSAGAENRIAEKVSELGLSAGEKVATPNETTEQPIIDALFKMGAVGLDGLRASSRDKRPTGDRLAPKAIGRGNDGQFKGALAHMVDLGWLDNGRAHGLGGGYFLTDAGVALATKRREKKLQS